MHVCRKGATLGVSVTVEQSGLCVGSSRGAGSALSEAAPVVEGGWGSQKAAKVSPAGVKYASLVRFPSVPHAISGNGSGCKLSLYFFNCLQILMLPFV